jgi:hypothetical protein
MKTHNHSLGRFLAGLLILLSLLGGGTPGAAQADRQPSTDLAPQVLEPYTNGIGDAWVVTGVVRLGGGCVEYETIFDSIDYVVDGATYLKETIVAHGNTVYMAERLNVSGSSGDGSIPLYAAQDISGLSYADFPLPANTPLTITLTLYQGAQETPVFRSQLSYECNTGAFEVLEQGPLSPSLPVVNLLARNTDTSCTSDGLLLTAYVNLPLGQSYLLVTEALDGNGDPLGNNTSEIINGGTEVRSFPWGLDLEQGNVLVVMTVATPGGQPLYSSSAELDCNNATYFNRQAWTPLMPEKQALVVNRIATNSCQGNLLSFWVNLFTDAGRNYTYHTRVTQGGVVRIDSDLYGPVEPAPGMNTWQMGGNYTLSPSTPALVTVSILDSGNALIDRRQFYYSCAGSGWLHMAEYRFLPLTVNR